MTPALDVSHLPDYEISSDAPIAWGQFSIIAIETTMFMLLIAAYFYLRLGLDVWPPPGEQFPHVLLPSLAWIPLLLSVPPAYFATEFAKKNNRRGVIISMVLNLLFASIFLVMRIVEWHSFNFQWNSSAHGSIVWVILGLHTFDYGAMMLETVVIVTAALSGKWGPKLRSAVHADSLTWYFIVAIWIPLYVTVYWGPRLVESR
jgi:cytochrome c oxidase subunit 3